MPLDPSTDACVPPVGYEGRPLPYAPWALPGGRQLTFDRPRVMAIINLTPDSFVAHSRAAGERAALEAAEGHLKNGADLLDLGAASSRPHADPVDAETEWARLAGPLEALRRAFPEAILSLDTDKALVVGRALEAGADVINDIGGGRTDEGVWPLVAGAGVPYILMHSRGTPKTMTTLTDYPGGVLKEVTATLEAGLACARRAGIAPGQIALDPGLGFAKTLEQNYALLAGLPRVVALGAPVLVGVSRKGMIWRALGLEGPEGPAPLTGTTALHALALAGGAAILRVHEPAEARQVITLMGHWPAG